MVFKIGEVTNSLECLAGGKTKQQLSALLLKHLRRKSLLLILDNVCEALIDDGSNFKKVISSLLDDCALLRVLICPE